MIFLLVQRSSTTNLNFLAMTSFLDMSKFIAANIMSHKPSVSRNTFVDATIFNELQKPLSSAYENRSYTIKFDFFNDIGWRNNQNNTYISRKAIKLYSWQLLHIELLMQEKILISYPYIVAVFIYHIDKPNLNKIFI